MQMYKFLHTFTGRNYTWFAINGSKLKHEKKIKNEKKYTGAL